MPFYELSRQFGKSREERKKCWRKPLKILQLRRWKTWFSLTTDEWSWSRLSIRMNKSQRISRGLHWRERRFCCQTTHTRVPKGKKAADKSWRRARYILYFCVLHFLKYSIWWWLSKKSIPYGFGTCICMCHIANAHFSCCPTKIWSSWWWVTLGCKYYAVALCSITWLTHIWPFLHLITYSRLAKPLLSSRMLQHKRLNKRWNKANSVKWKGRKEDERRSAKPGEQQTSSPWSSTLFYSLPEDTWKKGR